MRRIFELYASGRHTDRTIAEWLNSEGQRTAKGRLFGAEVGGSCWRCRASPAPSMLQLVFERVWLDDGRIVAVRPKHAFAPFFQKRATTRCEERERGDCAPR